jgi:predicted DNA-binding transcriptional regulator AlpA
MEGGYHEAEARLSEEQMAFTLRRTESTKTLEESCRMMGISEPTFYRRQRIQRL